MEAAFERGARYREAGADMLFIEAPVGRAQCEQVAAHFKGVPLLYNMAASGKTPDLTLDEMGRLGFKLANFALYGILAAIPAIQHVLGEIRKTGTVAHLRGQMATFKQLTDLVGLPEIEQLERRYGTPEDQLTRL